MSLASGVLKHIINVNRSCCLFSTHSSNLLEQCDEAAEQMQQFKMDYEISSEKDRSIKFLYKMVKGVASQSFSSNVL